MLERKGFKCPHPPRLTARGNNWSCQLELGFFKCSTVMLAFVEIASRLISYETSPRSTNREEG